MTSHSRHSVTAVTRPSGTARSASATATTRKRRRPSDELLPLSVVLEELGISRAAWYRWRNRGQGPVVRRLPNGHLRVRRSDLDAFLDEMEVA